MILKKGYSSKHGKQAQEEPIVMNDEFVRVVVERVVAVEVKRSGRSREPAAVVPAEIFASLLPSPTFRIPPLRWQLRLVVGETFSSTSMI